MCEIFPYEVLNLSKAIETNFVPVTLVLIDSQSHALTQVEGDAG